jgi:hypothetical protein
MSQHHLFAEIATWVLHHPLYSGVAGAAAFAQATDISIGGD